MLNANDLDHLFYGMPHVCAALMEGKTVWLRDPVDGWVITRMVSPYKQACDYHIGETSPEGDKQ